MSHLARDLCDGEGRARSALRRPRRRAFRVHATALRTARPLGGLEMGRSAQARICAEKPVDFRLLCAAAFVLAPAVMAAVTPPNARRSEEDAVVSLVLRLAAEVRSYAVPAGELERDVRIFLATLDTANKPRCDSLAAPRGCCPAIDVVATPSDETSLEDQAHRTFSAIQTLLAKQGSIGELRCCPPTAAASHNRWRFHAYRSVAAEYGFHQRAPLPPLCVVIIKAVFPGPPGGEYTGFRDARGVSPAALAGVMQRRGADAGEQPNGEVSAVPPRKMARV